MPITVRSGDSLSGIAQHNGVSLDELIRANPQVKNPNFIFPGGAWRDLGGSTHCRASGRTSVNLRPAARCFVGAVLLAAGCGADDSTRRNQSEDGSGQSALEMGAEEDPYAELVACKSWKNPVPAAAKGCDRVIEFVAFGDTQHEQRGDPKCFQRADYQEDQNALMINSINKIESQRWPSGTYPPSKKAFHRAGRNFSDIRGVLVAGDLTENGSEPIPPHAGYQRCTEYTHFRNDFGLCADKKLRYPVYEGYGNHDFPWSYQYDNRHRVVDYIDRRNKFRPAVVWTSDDQSPNSQRGHYAWKWGDVHFVNLNVKPSGSDGEPKLEEIEKNKSDPAGNWKRRVDPLWALSFLDAYVRDSGKVEHGAQLVLVSHYGPSDQGRFPRAERTRFCSKLKSYQKTKGVRVVAWIHGHTHKSDQYNWQCPDSDITIPVFNVGSPFYATPDHERRVHFAVFRLGNRRLEAIDVSVRASDGAFEIPGDKTPNDAATDNPDRAWGGWGYVNSGLLHAPKCP